MTQIKNIIDGTMIGPYKVIRQIGVGGMGAVYEAIDESQDLRVALKFIVDEFEKKEELTNRFRTEAKALERVNHPNVVSILGSGTYEGEPYIIMEYVSGRNLGEVLKQRKFTLEEAKPRMIQLLEGVRALHKNKIIHRDLKPQNIVFQKNGSVKIVDFGIAKLTDDTVGHTKVGAVIGSVKYMSPEVARGMMATFRSDIRSLGLIFYEMLVGKTPYSRKEFHLILQDVVNKDIRIPVSSYGRVPLEWRNLVNKMCERDPVDRYQAVADVLDKIKKINKGHKDQSEHNSLKANVAQEENKKYPSKEKYRKKDQQKVSRAIKISSESSVSRGTNISRETDLG